MAVDEEIVLHALKALKGLTSVQPLFRSTVTD